jgi:hypothetical protein
LLKIEDHHRLSGHPQGGSLLDLMSTTPSGAGVDFKPPKLKLKLTLTTFDLT